MYIENYHTYSSLTFHAINPRLHCKPYKESNRNKSNKTTGTIWLFPGDINDYIEIIKKWHCFVTHGAGGNFQLIQFIFEDSHAEVYRRIGDKRMTTENPAEYFDNEFCYGISTKYPQEPVEPMFFEQNIKLRYKKLKEMLCTGTHLVLKTYQNRKFDENKQTKFDFTNYCIQDSMKQQVIEAYMKKLIDYAENVYFIEPKYRDEFVPLPCLIETNCSCPYPIFQNMDNNNINQNSTQNPKYEQIDYWKEAEKLFDEMTKFTSYRGHEFADKNYAINTMLNCMYIYIYIN